MNKAEFKTCIWDANWFNDWVSVIMTIGDNRRELRRQLPVKKGLSYTDEQKIFEAARWYGISVADRYNRWAMQAEREEPR